MNTDRYILALIALVLNLVCQPAISAETYFNNSLHSKIKVLAVFAHPDDETWINGTLAKLAQQGHPLTVVYATSGDRGSDRSGRELSGADLAAVREQEAINALLALNIPSEPIFLRMGDLTLQDNIDELSVKISSLLLQTQANLVLSFGPGGMTGHPDHIAAGMATSLALDRNNHPSASLLNIAITEGRAQGLAEIAAKHGVQNYIPKERVSEEAINIEIKLSDFMTQRQNSPKAHLTQFPNAILNAWDEFVLTYPNEEVVVARKRMPGRQIEQSLNNTEENRVRLD